MTAIDATRADHQPLTRRERRSGSRGSAALGVVMLGVACVVLECRPSFHPALRMCVEPLFGASLWTWIIVRYYRHFCGAPPIDEVRMLSRQLSREVYFLLYVLVFARETVLLSRLALRGDGSALDQFHHASMAAFDRAVMGSPQAMPMFLAYGLGALLIVKGLATIWSYQRRHLPILGTAVAGDAGLLITVDKDLLVLRRFEGIDIIKPGDFWRDIGLMPQLGSMLAGCAKKTRAHLRARVVRPEQSGT